jgi:hypothetical protein
MYPFGPKDLSQERSRPGTVGGSNGIPRMGQAAPKKGRHRVNTQLPVLRIVLVATAAVLIFLVVHTALEAFSRTSSLLAGA